MDNQVFADEVGNIVVTLPVVRFDLMVLSPTELDAAGKPKLVLQERVVMPFDAFIRAAGKMTNTANDMLKSGAITATRTKTPAPAGSGAASAKIDSGLKDEA